MRNLARRARIARQLAAIVAAAALPVSGVILAAGAEERADAAEIDVSRPLPDPAINQAVPTAPAASPLATHGSEQSSPTTSSSEIAEETAEDLGSGMASFYGLRFAGRPTANGERFDPGGLTAAHRTLPFGSMVKVTDDQTGKSVVVRINDRGPFHGNRVIDLSREAAQQIGLVQRGRAMVRLALLGD